MWPMSQRWQILSTADGFVSEFVVVGEQGEKDAHSARPGEVSALPHLAAEQLHVHALYVLGRDL